MVGKEPEEYRPRRAFINPEPATEAPPPVSPSTPAETAPPAPPATPGVDDDETPKPLFRDEAAPTLIRARPASARRSRPAEEDATQLLPRTAAGSRRPRELDEDLIDDEPEHSALGRRGRLALLVGAVAAVVVIGLAIGYTVFNLGDQPTTNPSPNLTAGSTTATDTGSPTPTATPETLSDASMLTKADAAKIDGDRTWKVALTQRGVDDQAPQAACLSGTPADGLPTAQQTILRLLSSDGKNPPGVFHQASVYASADEAAQAYAVTAKSLGGCLMSGAYIDSGRVVTGLGDQSLGVVINAANGTKTEFHSVVLNRTGRVVNLVDVAQPDQAASVARVASAVGAATVRECKSASGSCPASISVKEGPPPLGGDVLGFLAPGDLPPAGDSTSLWVGDQPATPAEDLAQSGCETAQWSKVEADKHTARTYIQETGTPTFGLDEVILTTKNDKSAQAIVEQVKADLDNCEQRKLTATVSGPQEITGTGAKGTEISGWAASVSQQSTSGTAKFRVGIAAAGRKVTFIFLNAQKGLDLTDSQWESLTLRAGERASQVK